jgi:hypothetical protein
MRGFLVVLALAVLRFGNATPIRDAQLLLQAPLVEEAAVHKVATRKLHGRFLHITGKYSPQPDNTHPPYILSRSSCGPILQNPFLD